MNRLCLFLSLLFLLLEGCSPARYSILQSSAGSFHKYIQIPSTTTSWSAKGHVLKQDSICSAAIVLSADNNHLPIFKALSSCTPVLAVSPTEKFLNSKTPVNGEAIVNQNVKPVPPYWAHKLSKIEKTKAPNVFPTYSSAGEGLALIIAALVSIAGFVLLKFVAGWATWLAIIVSLPIFILTLILVLHIYLYFM